MFPSEGAPADAECLRCISANGSPIKPRCRWVAMEVRGRMKWEQEPGGWQAAASHCSRPVSAGKVSCSLRFFGVPSRVLAVLISPKGMSSASHLRGLCKATSLFPRCPPTPRSPAPPLLLVLTHPQDLLVCQLCQARAMSLHVPRAPLRTGPLPIAKSSLGAQVTMQWHPGHPSRCPSASFHPRARWQLEWHSGQGRGDGRACCGAGLLYHPQ